MKKTIAALSLAALMLTTTTAFAHNDGDKNGAKIGFWGRFGHRIEKSFVKDSKFVLTGTVASSSASSVTLTVKGNVNAQGIVNNQATVNVSNTTKISREKEQIIALADIKVGDQVVIFGTVSGSVLTATNLHVIAPHGRTFGEVTATSANSITIKNSVTGVSQTFATDGTTKVSINGESKTTADVQVGDKGFLKFKGEVSGLFAKFIALFR